MLFKETVTQATLDLIARLMRDPLLSHFYLVGGTALSLRIGHRKSIDIDLFTGRGFDSRGLGQYLEKRYGAEVSLQIKNCVKGQIEGVQFDLISHQYPHIRPLETIEGIRMMSLEDISAMKINAIVGSGTRIKDFIDIHYLLKEMDYRDMLEHYCGKYPDVTAKMASSSLLYHRDIDFSVPVVLYDASLKWKDVASSLEKAVIDHEKQLAKPTSYLRQPTTDYLGFKKNRDRDQDQDQGLGL